jgi:hypothetical protein
MSIFEKAIIYLSLICGTLFSLLSKGGIEFLGNGELVRGMFFLVVSILVLVGWIAPLINKYKSMGVLAGRSLALLLTLFSAYGFLRENFFSNLPPPWP